MSLPFSEDDIASVKCELLRSDSLSDGSFHVEQELFKRSIGADSAGILRDAFLKKEQEDYRNYIDSERQTTVATCYKIMHENQTVEHVRACREKYNKCERVKMTIEEAVKLLDELVDDSDPDSDRPNSFHDFQTAERIRQAWPDEEHDWFHLIGLLHDVGKVLYFFGEPQWSVVGDTFPVGCPFSEKCVFPEYFKNNPDCVPSNPKYKLYQGSKCGMYNKHCGFDNVLMSYGHDEYIYQFLKANTDKLPDEAYYIARYHSFYPWHSHGAYEDLASQRDIEMLKWLKEFNKYDLYSKSDKIPDIEGLWPYYRGLLAKYGLDGKLQF